MKKILAIMLSLSLMLSLSISGFSSPVKVEKEKLSYQVKPIVATTIMTKVNFLTVAFSPQLPAPAAHLVISKYGQEQRLTKLNQRTRYFRSFTIFSSLRKLRNYLATIYKPHLRNRWQDRVNACYRIVKRKRMLDIKYC